MPRSRPKRRAVRRSRRRASQEHATDSVPAAPQATEHARAEPGALDWGAFFESLEREWDTAHMAQGGRAVGSRAIERRARRGGLLLLDRMHAHARGACDPVNALPLHGARAAAAAAADRLPDEERPSTKLEPLSLPRHPRAAFAPALDALVPDTMQATGPRCVLHAHGSNFTEASEIIINGAVTPTVRVSELELMASVLPPGYPTSWRVQVRCGWLITAALDLRFKDF